MSPRSTTFRTKDIEFGFYLIFDSNGSMRLSRGESTLARSERSMFLMVTLPRALWSTPQMRATITIEDPGPKAYELDVSAAGNALREALGVDVDLRIMPHDPVDT